MIAAKRQAKQSIKDWFRSSTLITEENIDLFCFNTMNVAKLATNPVKVITNWLKKSWNHLIKTLGFLLAHVLNYPKDATRKSVRQLSCIFNISPSSLEPSHHITEGPSRQFVRETVWRLRRNSYLLCGKCFGAVRKWVAWLPVLLLFTYDDNKKWRKCIVVVKCERTLFFNTNSRLILI